MQSRVLVFHLDRDRVETVLVSDQHLEAPNWTPDGAALIVNGGGRLYRIPLDARELVGIETGFARKINNDHGVSPDGKSLVISDATEIGASRIYILPNGGGTPKLVVDKAPSYWHGWSPDGATIAYVANRTGTYQVYSCGIGGGAERQLTVDFDHTDGPDYTRDGQWIWFNGERDGRVQLWRMRPDGSGVESMTDDARVNWFPHPSPDGKHVLYLAYEEGTRGHPELKTVELRLMPAEGGPPRTLVQLLGGQGTINVPCWAPDGKAFAYIDFIV